MHSDQVNKGWISGRQALGRSTQQFVSQWEGLGSGDSTPQLSARSGADRPRRSLSQRQPRSQAAAQLPQFLRPQHPWPPKTQPQPTPHHSLVLDQGGAQQRKGCDPGLLLSGTTDAYTGGTELLCDYTGLTCFNNRLLGDRAWLNLTLRASTPAAGEQTPPWQDGDSHGAKRKPRPISSTGSGHHNTNHTPCTKGLAASTLWGKTWLASIPKPALGTFLAAFTAMAWVQSLVRELRSCKPRSTAKQQQQQKPALAPKITDPHGLHRDTLT